MKKTQTRMTERKKIRVLIARFCLLTYLLAWVGSAYSLAGLLMIMDSSHRILLTYTHDEIHLILHHPRNQNEKDLAVLNHNEHEHDVTVNASANFTIRQGPHPDHEIHLSNYEQPVPATTKTVKVSQNFSSLVTTQPLLAFDKVASVRFVTLLPPKGNPTLAYLRTTLLLI